jgi:hypothetical protein
VTTHFFRIQLVLTKRDIFNALFFFSNDVMPFLSEQFLAISSHFLTYFIFVFVIRDLNLFVEKKTSLGLFDLTEHLNLRIFINSKNDKVAVQTLESFKIYI